MLYDTYQGAEACGFTNENHFWIFMLFNEILFLVGHRKTISIDAILNEKQCVIWLGPFRSGLAI